MPLRGPLAMCLWCLAILLLEFPSAIVVLNGRWMLRVPKTFRDVTGICLHQN